MKDTCACVFTSLFLVGTTLLSMPAWSMDELTDGQLASTTGQDGLTLTVALPSNTLNVNQVAFFNNGNNVAGATGAGALVIGQYSVGTNGAGTNGISIPLGASLTVKMDATGGGNSTSASGAAPMMNIAISLPTTVFTVQTGDVGIAGATGAAGSYAVSTTGPGDVLIMGSTSVTTTLASAPKINVQLGQSSQGGMILLSSFNISSITYGSALALISPNKLTGLGAVGCSTAAAAPGCASTLTVTPSISNLNLTGATIDVENSTNFNSTMGTSGTVGGLVFQCANLSAQGCSVGSPTTGVNFMLSNITAGTSGSSDATFGGSKNASLGSFGLTNLTVSNLKIGVSGM